MSTVSGGIITSNVLNNLFDDVTGGEAAAGSVEYRCIYITNTNATLALTSPVIYLNTATQSSTTSFAIQIDGTAIGSNTVAASSTETTTPSGTGAPSTWVTETSATNFATGVSLGGSIPAGSKKAIWIRRTVTAGTASASESPSLTVEGTTT